VGREDDRNGVHAFSWTPRGGAVDLGSLGARYSVATAVNDRNRSPEQLK
jgi:hypothetical protein